MVIGGNLVFRMGDGEITNQQPAWEIWQEILWEILQEILWEILREILRDRRKSLFKKGSDWWKFSIWNRVMGN